MAEVFADYRPLKDDEVRVIKFDEIWPRTNKFSATLEYVNLHKKPVYFALSYVWGDASKTRTIFLNDLPFEVTVNLYDALQQIRDNAVFFQEMVRQELLFPYGELYLWVDAVCVNQNDHEEKIQQIPRMQAIYSSSYNVLIWLGSSKGTAVNPIGYARFLRESHEVSYINTWFEDHTVDHTFTGSHEFELHALFYSIFVILDLPWFGRLWTIQEYLLSQRPPLALLGPGVFALHTLYQIVENKLPKIVEKAFGDLRDKLHTALGNVKRKTVKLRLLGQLLDKIKSDAFRASIFAEQINYVLLRTFDKSSSVSHDQIYGLLGLVDIAKSPASLGINYRTPFGEVCRQYVKHILDGTGNLNILFCMKNELSGYPSWVPDLRYRSPSTGPTGKPLTKNNISWSADGHGLIAEGVCLGHILAYSSYKADNSNGQVDHQNSHPAGNIDTQLLHFYDTILTASAWLRKRSLRDVWEEWLSPYEQLNGCEVDYTSMEDFLAAGLSDEDKIGTTKTSERMLMVNVKQHFRTMNYGLMHDGQLLLCWPTVEHKAKQYDLHHGKARHEVWALKGTDLLAILSQDGRDHRLLGFCVPTRGMMIPIGNLDLDDDFFSAYETRTATIY